MSYIFAFYTMKGKLSVSLGEKTLEKVSKALDGGFFRNKSHIVEFAINRLLEEEE